MEISKVNIKKIFIGILILFSIILNYSGNFKFNNDVFTSPDENIILSLANNISNNQYNLGNNPDFEVRGTRFVDDKIVSGKFYGFPLFLSIYNNFLDYKLLYIFIIVSTFLGAYLFFKEIYKKKINILIAISILIFFPIIFLWFNKGIMEHPLPIALLFYGLFFIEKGKYFIGYLLLSLMCFYRPDYFLIFIIIFLYYFIEIFLSNKSFSVKLLKLGNISLISLIGVIPLVFYNKLFNGGYLKIGPSVLYEKTSNSKYIPVSPINDVFTLDFLKDFLSSFLIIPTLYIGVIISIFFYYKLKNIKLRKYIIIFNLSLLLLIVYLIFSGARFNLAYDNSIYRYLLPFEIFFTVFLLGFFLDNIKSISTKIIFTSLLLIFFFNNSFLYAQKNINNRLYYNEMLNTLKNDISEKPKLIITDYLDKIYNIDYDVIYLKGKGDYYNLIDKYYNKYGLRYDIYLSFGDNIELSKLDKYYILKLKSSRYIKIYQIKIKY